MQPSCFSSFAVTPGQRWGPAVSVGWAGSGGSSWAVVLSLRSWEGVGMCLADSAFQVGEDAQGSPKAFHSISEHPCRWQQG